MENSKISIERWVATMRAGGKVQRCHTLPTIKKQTVAEHSWGVCILLKQFFPQARQVVYFAALTHDVAEVVTGDVPADAKWNFPNLKNAISEVEHAVNTQLMIDFDLTEEEKHALKLCDLLDLLLFCVEEVFMGNKNMIPVAEKVIAVMDGMKMPTDFTAYYNNISGRFNKKEKEDGERRVDLHC